MREKRRSDIFFAGLLSLALVGPLAPGAGNLAAGEVSENAVISEFMARNDATLDDEDGESSDWIEVRNESATLELDLSGCSLTDEPRVPVKWRFPQGVVLAPGEHLLVFASGKNRAVSGKELHTNFRLAASGEFLALIEADGQTLAHLYAPSFPRQFTDVSYGLPADSDEPFYLASPTPGAPNSGPGAIGPVISEPDHAPRNPRAGDSIVVTARVEELLAPVESVTMTSRVMYGPEAEPVEMRDDGGGGDETAGDGVYTAVIPGSSFGPGDMVRWRFTAADENGITSRSPPFRDPRASPRYHGTVIADPTVATELPVFHWFLRPGTEGAANTRTGTRASISFLGELYDNVFVRIRGGSTTRLRKKSYKFDFNRRHHFLFDPRFGRVSEINLNTTFTDKSYVRQSLAFEIFDRSGAPGSEAFLTRVQRNGGFFSVAVLIEQPDEDLLRREGLDDRGALYKMFNTFTSASSGVEKKNRHHENHRDLAFFISRMNGLSGPDLKNYVFDNVDVPRMLDYLGANVLTQNNDCMAKNYYLYRDSDGSGEWFALPWDLDLTFGRHFMTDDNILGDTIWADKDFVLGGSPPSVPIAPSHPLMGIQELPGNRSWNRLIDALFEVPEFAEMFRRRLRTLMDRVLQPPGTPEDELLLEKRLDELATRLGPDAELDLARWGQFGARQTLAQAMEILEERYLDVRRRHLFVTHLRENADSYPERRAFPALVPREQPPYPAIDIADLEFNPSTGNQDEEFIELRNPGDFAVDISGWQVTGGVEHVFRAGTVLLAGQSIFLSPDAGAFRSRADPPTGGAGLFVQGAYDGHLSNFGETLCLLAGDGETIDCMSYDGSPSDQQLFLRVTELHFHPAPPSRSERAAGFDDQDEFEFVELSNIHPELTVPLDGVRFSEGIRFDFTGTETDVLGPGESAVVVSNREAFELRYGEGVRVAGQYWPMRFDNDGERVKLEDRTNSTIVEFEYDDNPDLGWPASADGGGPSLEIVDVAGDYEAPSNWRASARNHGTPGSHSSSSTPLFIRGDANLDASVDISDAVSILLHLFSGKPISCRDAADVDDSEVLDITDVVNLLGFLFRRGPAPPPPYPARGTDPAGESLECETGL